MSRSAGFWDKGENNDRAKGCTLASLNPLKSKVKRILKKLGLVKQDRAEDLLELGVNHFAREYPQLNRNHCPPSEMLGTLVQSGKLPPDEIREHLFTCSDCFVNYRQELSRRHASESPIVGIAERGRRIPRLVPAVAAALVSILTIVAIFVVVKRNNEQSRELAHVNSNLEGEGKPSGLRSISPAPTPPHVSTRSPAPQNRSDSRPVIAENKLDIDLDRYNALRGAGGSIDRPVLLKTTKNELTVKLPDASPAGRYRVSLTDPFGTSLQSVAVNSRDGVQLSLELDLTSVKPGKYFVCVSRETEVPQCVPALIEPRRNRK